MDYMLPNGQRLGIRFVDPNDAGSLLTMFQRAVRESSFLLTTPKEADRFSVSQEREFIVGCLRNPNNCFLVGLINGHIVGSANVTQSKFHKQAHVGEFGILVLRSCWNLGIGRKLIHATEQWITLNSKIRYIQLQVLASNLRAIHLYQNFGFQEECIQRRAVYDDTNGFQDLILMGKWLNA